MKGKGEKHRIMGAILGAFIGDALGLGCHWYYDLEQLRKDYGEWISDYCDPKPDRTDKFAKIARFRYEAGLRAGDLSQTGQITLLLLESVAERGRYDEEDFVARLDGFLDTLDGTPFSGRYTDWAMRDVWHQRRSGLGWEETGSRADTAEAAIRSTVLAARYSKDLEELAQVASLNIRLTHRESYVASQSLSFALTVGAVIQGSPLEQLGDTLGSLAGRRIIHEQIPSYDCLTQAKNGAVALKTPFEIEPASFIASICGLACTLGFMLPAAYYLLHRYPDNFEMAVLSAVNGGGNNMARAALTGALSGAMTGLEGIPQRFIRGLRERDRILQLAQKVEDQAHG